MASRCSQIIVQAEVRANSRRLQEVAAMAAAKHDAVEEQASHARTTMQTLQNAIAAKDTLIADLQVTSTIYFLLVHMSTFHCAMHHLKMEHCIYPCSTSMPIWMLFNNAITVADLVTAGLRMRCSHVMAVPQRVRRR